MNGCYAVELRPFDSSDLCFGPAMFVSFEPARVVSEEAVVCWGEAGSEQIYLPTPRHGIPGSDPYGFRGCTEEERATIATLTAVVNCVD